MIWTLSALNWLKKKSTFTKIVVILHLGNGSQKTIADLFFEVIILINWMDCSDT